MDKNTIKLFEITSSKCKIFTYAQTKQKHYIEAL